VNDLLVGLVAVEAALLLVTAAAATLHAWIASARRRRDAARLAAARTALLDELGVSPPSQGGGEIDVLLPLPRRVQARLVTELADLLGGAHRERLCQAAYDCGLLPWAERRARSRRWRRRLTAASVLSTSGNRPLLLSLLHDPSPDVRVQAAGWARRDAAPEVVAALVAQLADPDALPRFVAQDALQHLGAAGADALAEILTTGPRRQVLAALPVATAVCDGRFMVPALHLARSPDPAVRAGAAMLLGGLGGEQGAAALGQLLHDDDAGVRAQAATALAHVGEWSASDSIADLLHDRAWIARRAAGLALRGLGSAGLLQLRRALRDHDRFAADMARHVIDLPDRAASG
jgi:hypothetical protein